MEKPDEPVVDSQISREIAEEKDAAAEQNREGYLITMPDGTVVRVKDKKEEAERRQQYWDNSK